MKHRTTIALIALLMTLTSCRSTTTETETTQATTTPSTNGVSTTTTTAATRPDGPSAPSGSVDAPEATLLAYSFEPDSVLSYQLDLEQQIVMHADGDAGAMGEDELPMDADIGIQAQSVMSYEVFPGPEADTFEVVITADFDDVEITGTVNGESVDELDEAGMASDLASVDPVSTSVIIDAAGNIISDHGAPVDLFGGGLDALGGLATDDLGRPVGPRFPTDRELTVGDSWTETTTEDGPDGTPVTVTSTHTVIDAQRIGSSTTLVIESVTNTDAIEIDFSDFFRALFEGFAGLGGEDAEGELPPEFQEMLDELVFVISVDPSTATTTSWFDPESGIVRRAESSSQVAIAMTFVAPDDTTGELVRFEMEMDMNQTVVLALLDSST